MAATSTVPSWPPPSDNSIDVMVMVTTLLMMMMVVMLVINIVDSHFRRSTSLSGLSFPASSNSCTPQSTGYQINNPKYKYPVAQMHHTRYNVHHPKFVFIHHKKDITPNTKSNQSPVVLPENVNTGLANPSGPTCSFFKPDNWAAQFGP